MTDDSSMTRLGRLLVLIGLATGVWLVPTVADAQYVIKDRAKVRDYTIALSRDEDEGLARVVITRGRKVVYQRDSEQSGMYAFERLSNKAGTGDGAALVGVDLNANGVPDVAFSFDSQCCNTLYIVELGDPAKEVLALESHRRQARFARVDDDAIPEILADDSTYGGWNASLAESPAPRVILKARNGAFAFAGDLMRRPPPPPEELGEIAASVRGHESWGAADAASAVLRAAAGSSSVKSRAAGGPPALLWKTMLDLVYSGQAAAAWRFLEEAWPADQPGREAFRADLESVMRTSPYWDDLRAMNPGAL
jgi:hypothetical protein